MDGGDGALGLRRLDPSAQEFHPSPYHFALPPPQIYQPYPPPPPAMHLLPPPPPPTTPAAVRTYVSHGPAEALPDAVPTRSVLLSSVPCTASEGLVRMEVESFGGVRAVDVSRLASESIVTVHFHDLRAARAALDAVRAQHVRHQERVWQHLNGAGAGGEFSPWELGMVGGRAVWAQFAPEPPGQNNGSLVVFNLDPSVSSESLRDVFQSFGAVKETRETPMKPGHRFVEFYDTRDAARALLELNGRELFGRKVVIEYSRPGGHGRSNYSRKSSSSSQQQMPLARSSSNISSSSSHDEECAKRGGSSSQKGKSMKSLQRSRSRSRAAMEASFLIKGDEAVEGSSSPPCKDTRTTVMIKNIPNKYSQKLLLNMLDNHCMHCNELLLVAHGDQAPVEQQPPPPPPLSSYDFVYLPIDFNNKCNVGYGFVNMTSPEATWRLYKAFHLQAWEVFNSRKICQITYARLQGLEVLLDHFKNSKFACDNDEYMPVYFTPPRDGRNMTPPATVGGRSPGAGGATSPLSKMVLLRVEDGGGGGSWSPGSSNEEE